MLEALEFHVGEQVGVFVVQVDDKADIDLIVIKVIDERSAASILAQRPAHRVRDGAGLVLGGIDFPDFFHAKAVFLRLGILRKVVFRDDLLGQRPAHAFGQEDVFAQQFHPRLVARTFAAVGVAAKFTSNDTGHAAVVAPDQFGTRHAGEDFDAKRLCLFGHPAADVAHRHDIVAVVVHQRRHGEVRHADFARFAQQIEVVFFHGHGDRRAAFFPVGHQAIKAAGVQHGAGQDMRADF